jgi:iron complex outermembrane receptor protein
MRFKKNIFLSLSIFLAITSGTLHAQKFGIIKGVVTDISDKEAIAGAHIYDPKDRTHGVTTDINGNYQLRLSPEKHSIVCSFISMKTDSINVVIDSLKPIEHNFVLESASTQLETMVVSAGKYERKLEEITVSMEVIKPALIENKNSSNIKGVLEQVPGLNILDGEPQIRGGSGFDFGVGSRVAILIDGLPALSGDGSALPWNFIPLENVEQIEVIKGASSVTYGSSALSGSVNVRTAYAKDEPITKVALSSGFYDAPHIENSKWWKGAANFSNVSVMHAQKFGQLDLVISAMAIYDHGFIGPPGYNPNIIDTTIKNNQVGERTARFNFNLRYRPKKIPQLNYGINGNFMRSTNNMSLIWNNDSSGLYRAYPFTMTLQQQTIFYLDPFINFYSTNGLIQSLRTRYLYTKDEATNSATSATDLSTETSMAYAEYQISKQINEGLNITGGLIENQTFSHSGLAFQGVVPNNHLQNYAGYAQVDKKLWSVLNLSLGVRDELFKMNNDKIAGKPIFRSGINLKLAKATFLRCSFGQGYRYPSIKEKFIHSDIGGLPIFPNPQLQAESSWNAEIGFKQGFKINNFIGSIDAAAFWQEYQNTIEITYGAWDKEKDKFGNDSLSTGFKYLNTGSTRVRGFELSLPASGKISKNLKVEVLADYTYVLPQAINPSQVYAVDSNKFSMSYNTTSTNTANNILKYRFQHIAKTDLQFTYKKYFIGGDWRYYSFMENIDEIFYLLEPLAHYGIQQYREKNNKATNIFDVRVGMDITKKFKVAFVVNNIANISYSLRPLKIEPQRTFALRLSAQF